MKSVQNDLPSGGRGAQPRQLRRISVQNEPFREKDDRLGRRGGREPLDQPSQREQRGARSLACSLVDEVRLSGQPLGTLLNLGRVA